jgi:hypothetical protein
VNSAPVGTSLVVSNANPDRTRVAGSAMVLKSTGDITDPSIPENAIVEELAKENKIFEGKIKVEPLSTPKIKPELLIK